MRELGDREVRAGVDPDRLVAAVAHAIGALGDSRAVQMAKQTIPTPSGGFFLSVGGLVTALGLATGKWASYVPAEHGEGTSTSRITVSDAVSGTALAVVDGMAATHLRTAATTAAIMHLLHPEPIRRLALVGFGPTNRETLHVLTPRLPDLERVTIIVRSAEGAARARAAVQDRPGAVVENDAAAIVAADVLVVATGARAPVVSTDALAEDGLGIALDGRATWRVGADVVTWSDEPARDGALDLAPAFARGVPAGKGRGRRLAVVGGYAVADVALAALLLEAER